MLESEKIVEKKCLKIYLALEQDVVFVTNAG